jgi:very-short-patch-repair endonuclease
MSNRTKISFSSKEVKAILEGKISDEDIVDIVKNRLVSKEILLEKTSIFTKERKEKLSKQRRGLNRERELSQVAEDFKSNLIINQTPAEKTFKAILKSLNIEYEFQKIIYTSTRFYIVDFYIPKIKSVFEIDGEYHNEVEQRKYDLLRTTNLKSLNIEEVYRFSNEDVLKNHLYIEDRIKSLKIQ